MQYILKARGDHVFVVVVVVEHSTDHSLGEPYVVYFWKKLISVSISLCLILKVTLVATLY